MMTKATFRQGPRWCLHPSCQAPLHDRHAAHLWRHRQGKPRKTTWRCVPWMTRALYGKELYVITFSEAVKRGLLVDYKVIVLAVEGVARQPPPPESAGKTKTTSSRWTTPPRSSAAGRRYPNRLHDRPERRRASHEARRGLLSGDRTAKGGKMHKVSSKQIAACSSGGGSLSGTGRHRESLALSAKPSMWTAA
jgi:hypothetical protein